MASRPPVDEYSTVRTEILALQTRAHEVWKWGIISLFLILGALLSTLLGLDQDSAIARAIVALVARYTLVLAVLLLLFGAAIAASIIHLSSRYRELVSRMGAYLAVFHDGAGAPDASCLYGWHVWVRIEKVAATRLKMKALPASRMYASHGVTRIYIPLFAFYASVVVLLCGAVDPSSVGTLTGISIVVAAGLGLTIEFMDRRLRKRATWWNARWSELAAADPEQVAVWLRRAWLARGDAREP